MPPKASTSASKANNSAKSTSSGATAGVKKSGSTGASSAGTSKNASKSVVRNGSSNYSNGYGDANEDDEREPVASTSSNRASSQQAPLQMTQLEVILHNAALASSKRTILSSDIKTVEGMPDDPERIKDTLNSLLRKNLFSVGRNARGEMAFKAVPKNEARELAAMDPEDKIVLEYITQAHNQGIWTRSLKQKTGLHQNVISRAIKTLEQRKLIKNVKSVKHPTRKIYMLYNVTPSIDVTGGPWYSGNDLDVEFIGALQSLAKQYIRKKSFPDGKSDLLWPQAHIPYLPTANDILDYLTEKDVLRGVELDIEHIEAVLNVLVWDGEIERLWIRRYQEDGPAASYDFDDLANGFRAGVKRRVAGEANGQVRKKRRARSDSGAIDEESEDAAGSEDIPVPGTKQESDAESDEGIRRAEQSADEDYLPPPLRQRHENGGRLAANHRRPGPQNKEWYWVYRTSLTAIASGQHTSANGSTVPIYPHLYELGLTQTPCGICPVAEFCQNRGQPKVLPLPGEKDLLSTQPSLAGDAGIVSLNDIAGKSSKTIRKRYDDLLKMKVPSGGGELEDADGKWKGSVKVGGTVVAPVNPAGCLYYAQWFGEEFEW